MGLGIMFRLKLVVSVSRRDLQSRTNVHYLVFHLTIADTIISFITMPMETTWRMFIEVMKMMLTMSKMLTMMTMLKMPRILGF